MTVADRVFDAVIIGAGLGGLSTGIRLRQAGLSVLVIERLARAGGLCGTVVEDGLEYVIACNDFGSGIRKDMQELGVEFLFEEACTRVLYGKKFYCLPPDARTILQMLPHASALIRHVLGQRSARARRYMGSPYLAEHLERQGVSGASADLLMLPSYLMGVSPDRFRLDALDHEFQFKYGYSKPVTPVGGPQRFANALAERFEQLGGQLKLNTTFLGSRKTGRQEHQVDTTQGSCRARHLVTTLSPSDEAGAFESGLSISMLWLRLDGAFEFPKGVHTHVYYPPGISDWFGSIYDGSLPEDFGFHLFCSDLGVQSAARTANVYFYAPKGHEDVHHVQQQMTEYVFRNIDKLIPGVRSAIQSHRFISPSGFMARHQFLPRVTPWIVPAGTPSIMNYDPERDIYFAGASAYPPGDHAGSAIRSSAHVARIIQTHRE
ncbi:MAG: NAD(P)-binding protein [Lautropia sp.]|nr:NAD(P)-binding protein [Lautropia sp.]